MKYTIRGTVMQTVDVTLAPGETVYTESGGMAWMTANIEMDSNLKGGLRGALGRVVSGASLFLVDYTATGGEGMVTFANEFPGKILDFTLAAGQSLICQKNAFMAAEKSVTLEGHFHRRLGAGLFGGEGFFLQSLTGPGVVFVELAGEITQYPLQAGQRLLVNPGHVALLDPSVGFDITTVPGIKNILFGGEGLFLVDLQGPGNVWLQSMPLPNLAGRLAPYLPKRN